MRHNLAAHGCALVIFLAVFPVHLYAQEGAPTDTVQIRDLGTALDPGYILLDKNGDSVTDFVNARIILPARASAAHLAGAANIAARLGYETSAMNLDLVDYASPAVKSVAAPVILVGGDDAWRDRIAGYGRSAQLAPGEGSIHSIAPNSYFRQGGLQITGGDASGLLAAASYCAGRYPNIWNVSGKTIEDVRKQFSAFLRQREIAVDSIRLDRIVVGAQKPGVLSLMLTVNVPDMTAFTRAGDALSGREKLPDDIKAPRRTDLEFRDVHHIGIFLACPDTSRVIRLEPAKPWNTKVSGTQSVKKSPDFTLSQFYAAGGIFRDSNQDFVPDDVTACVLVSGSENAQDVVNVAARIGLESAGIRIPLVRVEGAGSSPGEYGLPLFFGAGSAAVARLIEENKIFGITGMPGTGYIQYVPDAFDEKGCLVISGADAEGVHAAAEYAAKKLPYIGDYGKGNFQLRDIENDVKDFFQVRGAPGQAALALYKLSSWLDRLKDKDVEKIDVEIAAKAVPERLDAFTEKLVKDIFPRTKVSAHTYKTGFGAGKEIFNEEFSIPWEVDEFWEIFTAEVLPGITAGSRGSIRVRVSESPGIRRELKTRIERELSRKGAENGAVSVSVLSAYKQGFSWLYDEILPRIRNTDIGGIEISYHSLKDSKEVKWQTIYSNIRWLQELYPVDAVLAHELHIPDSLITFTPTLKRHPVYTVRVVDRSGREALAASFNPRYVVRPFFDLFPEYESVRVTTGWTTAVIDGDTLVSRRIKTDPERFWDHLQTKTYRRIIDYVMDIQEGRPSSGNAPYFDEFRVDLSLSEPNYRLNIDEEVISSAEALHEDIYFETLTLFNLIGGRYNAGSMNYPGRILPYIHPQKEGKPGKASIVLTGKERARPELVMTYTERGKEPVRRRYSLSAMRVKEPKLRGIWAEAGAKGLSQLLFEAAATDSVERYEEFKERASESRIDQTFIAAEKMAGMVAILGELHDAGIFEDELSYDRVGSLLFRITLEDSAGFSRMANLPRSRHPKTTENPRLSAGEFTYRGERLVQWDTPIGPDEAAAILARLNTFPNINVYYVARSFLGQNMYAADLLPPVEAAFISQAKLNALKPTLFISGRQHANEVSSTSHILRLAELIATDPSYAEYLKKVNLVLHPITNIDGARLAVEMQKENPDFMLHAGYLGALGVDVDSDGSSSDPRYPESQVRRNLRETWLPDVYLNPHGYPSHEWVQYFAGYSAWVRNRSGGQRSWWSPRGWFMPGFRWIEDKKYPDHKTVSYAILDSIAAAVTSLPGVTAANRRLYKRYKKYGVQDRENFHEYFHNGVLVNASLKGSKMSGSGITSPKITYFSLTTEAPDETARGEWLRMVCRAGLAHTTAVLKYLAEGVNTVTRDAKEYQDVVTRSVSRKRPVLPAEPEKSEKKKGT